MERFCGLCRNSNPQGAAFCCRCGSVLSPEVLPAVVGSQAAVNSGIVDPESVLAEVEPHASSEVLSSPVPNRSSILFSATEPAKEHSKFRKVMVLTLTAVALILGSLLLLPQVIVDAAASGMYKAGLPSASEGLLKLSCALDSRELCFLKGRITLYKNLCDTSNAQACGVLGEIYYDETPGERNVSEAKIVLKKGCDRGAKEACVNLGRIFESADAAKKNYSLAGALYKQGCDAGNMAGCAHLGSMYYNGTGVIQDYSQAIVLLTVACDADNSYACINLGTAYEEGHGVRQDSFRAASYYKRVCLKEDAHGCIKLQAVFDANRYYWISQHPDLEPTGDQSVAAYKRGCSRNDQFSCSLLGDAYVWGQLVPKDIPRGMRLLRSSCDAKIADACILIGERYQDGRGGAAPNWDQTLAFYKKACDLGNCENLKKAEDSMKPTTQSAEYHSQGRLFDTLDKDTRMRWWAARMGIQQMTGPSLVIQNPWM
jgi:TPR repeat protein